MLNTPHWQTASTRPEPFVAGPKSRPLRLIVCDAELEPSPALDLLVTFAARRGPLSFVSPSGSIGGKLTVSSDQTEIDYSYKGGDGVRAFVYGDWWKTTGPKEAARLGIEAATLERHFFFLHEAARRESIDGLVMPFDPRLRDYWRNLLADARLMSVDQAAALMGLYLRACGERIVEIDPHGAGIMASEERMYLLGALSVLPRYEVLHEAVWDAYTQSGDPVLVGLTDALAVRLGRALKARDYLQVRRRAPAVEEIWSDVLYFFESVLVCLQGALDAAARLVHELFQVEGSRRQANWGRDGWWSRLDKSSAPVQEFDRDALTDLDVLVGDLRNSIHGEVLSGELRQRVQPGEKPRSIAYPQRSVALDTELAGPVSKAASRRGGPARWAVRGAFPETAALLDPWRYAEAAIVTTAAALSNVIGALVDSCFMDTVITPAAQDLQLGKETQRKKAGILFGLEQMPDPKAGSLSFVVLFSNCGGGKAGSAPAASGWSRLGLPAAGDQDWEFVCLSEISDSKGVVRRSQDSCKLALLSEAGFRNVVYQASTQCEISGADTSSLSSIGEGPRSHRWWHVRSFASAAARSGWQSRSWMSERHGRIADARGDLVALRGGHMGAWAT